jgi:hypothetical protein
MLTKRAHAALDLLARGLELVGVAIIIGDRPRQHRLRADGRTGVWA